MPLSRRLPKRGFRNPFREEYRVVNLGNLEGFAAGSVVDHAALIAAGIVRSNQQRVKILADGELTKALTVKAQAFSSKAREKIVALGGAAEVV
jgi:large subunit ribosomal protein L15